MTDHVCDENCSWMQTPATMRARGYDVPVPPRDAKPQEKYAEESGFNDAKHEAWNKGEIRVCTKRPKSNV